MSSMTKLATLAAAFGSVVSANPSWSSEMSAKSRRFPNGQNGYSQSSINGNCGPCGLESNPCANVPAGVKLNPTEVNGPIWITGEHWGPEDSLSLGETHTTTVTWTAGGSLGIPLTDISFTGSYSESASNAVSESGSATCPGTRGVSPWQCALQVTPKLWETSGFLGIALDGDDTNKLICGYPDQPFDVTVPATDSAGNNVIDVEVCICPNADGSPMQGLPPNPPPMCSACL